MQMLVTTDRGERIPMRTRIALAALPLLALSLAACGAGSEPSGGAAGCLATWPALTSKKPATAGQGTDAALLTTITGSESGSQARYGEWPLYYYAADVTPGDVNGQGVDGEWFVIKDRKST